jgi:hypothetical protein
LTKTKLKKHKNIPHISTLGDIYFLNTKMKRLITENEYDEIKKLHSLNEEDFFSDIFNKLTGLLSGSKEDESKKEEPSKVNANLKTGKITHPNSTDKHFYESVLKGLDAPVSSENLAFLYAWRQAEGAKATFNPFNTTYKKDNSTLWNCLRKKEGRCVGGVRNYKSEEDGISATIKTLKNGHYKCIVDGLKNNIGAKKISQCSDLKTWGTGGGVKRVLDGGKVNPPQISRVLVKKV